MLLGDAEHYAETKPEVLLSRFRGEERLEGPLPGLLAHAVAGVLDRDDDVVARCQVRRLGGHSGVRDLDRKAAAPRHRLARVLGQACQGELDLVRVDRRGRGLGPSQHHLDAGSG